MKIFGTFICKFFFGRWSGMWHLSTLKASNFLTLGFSILEEVNLDPTGCLNS